MERFYKSLTSQLEQTLVWCIESFYYRGCESEKFENSLMISVYTINPAFLSTKCLCSIDKLVWTAVIAF